MKQPIGGPFKDYRDQLEWTLAENRKLPVDKRIPEGRIHDNPWTAAKDIPDADSRPSLADLFRSSSGDYAKKLAKEQRKAASDTSPDRIEDDGDRGPVSSNLPIQDKSIEACGIADIRMGGGCLEIVIEEGAQRYTVNVPPKWFGRLWSLMNGGEQEGMFKL